MEISTEDMPEAFIETHSLTKCYGSLTALDGCRLQVERGEVFGLLGPNGSGKTTLLRLLMGFLRPTAGRARIDGLDCYLERYQVHQRVAYLPGDARLYRHMRAGELLRFFCRLRPDADFQRASALAERFELDLSRPVAMLSTGMRQKLALAVVLTPQTPLVILDEPTSNLDPNVRSDVLAVVREARAEGRTVLFSSHVLDEVEEVCDRVAILRHGRLVHLQALAEIRRQHRIRARLTGPLPAAPVALAEGLRIEAVNDDVEICTLGELSPLLGWLATLPLAEVRIEPVGLRAVYDTFHPASRA